MLCVYLFFKTFTLKETKWNVYWVVQVMFLTKLLDLSCPYLSDLLIMEVKFLLCTERTHHIQVNLQSKYEKKCVYILYIYYYQVQQIRLLTLLALNSIIINIKTAYQAICYVLHCLHSLIIQFNIAKLRKLWY